MACLDLDQDARPGRMTDVTHWRVQDFPDNPELRALAGSGQSETPAAS